MFNYGSLAHGLVESGNKAQMWSFRAKPYGAPCKAPPELSMLMLEISPLKLGDANYTRSLE